MECVRNLYRVLAISGVAICILLTLACLVGLFAFAYFQQMGCDPLADRRIVNPNQVSQSDLVCKTFEIIFNQTRGIQPHSNVKIKTYMYLEIRTSNTNIRKT